MRFGKSLLTPGYWRKPDFDSVDSTIKTFNFRCVNCQKKIEKEFALIIGKEFGWHDDFDEKTYSEIKKKFDMNAVNKTPDGSWTAVLKTNCEECRTDYLIYAGVNEYCNSAYKINLQGISEILNESHN